MATTALALALASSMSRSQKYTASLCVCECAFVCVLVCVRGIHTKFKCSTVILFSLTAIDNTLCTAECMFFVCVRVCMFYIFFFIGIGIKAAKWKTNCDLCAVFVFFFACIKLSVVQHYSHMRHIATVTQAHRRTHTHALHTYGNMHICKYICMCICI